MTERLNGLIYDCEIYKAIPGNSRIEGIQYCNGWNDFEDMGISCICCYDLMQMQYRIFLADGLDDFQTLVDGRELIIGFNSLCFDDYLCQANGIDICTNYDLLCEIRLASGQPPLYVKGLTRAGYNLEALAQVNLDRGKSGFGKLAPVLWQQGEIGKVIDYCLQDVQITKELFERRHALKDPTNADILCLRDMSAIADRYGLDL